MSATDREYRVRIAERGAGEVEGSVEFILSTTILSGEHPLQEVPVVTGTLVHPLRGATEMRPFTVRGVDYQGGLIQAFADEGRWTAIGRLVDCQFRDLPGGVWTNYGGTGRCSGLDELDGPGLFRIEVADESWVSRKTTIWNTADTTSLWPPGTVYDWRGWRSIVRVGDDGDTDVFTGVQGSVVESVGNLRRVRFTYQFQYLLRTLLVSDDLYRWLQEDQVTEPSFVTTGNLGGNFKTARLWFVDDGASPNPDGSGFRGWEVVSFGGLDDDSMYDSIESVIASQEELSTQTLELNIWIRWPGIPFQQPPESGRAMLWAPNAKPSRVLPLHIGVQSPSHPWGNPGVPDGEDNRRGGYIHPADATRRMWEAMGLRYDADSLAEIEGDMTFPAIAGVVLDGDEDPERYAEREWWGPCGLVALKDAQGKRKLVDVRAVPEDFDTSGLPVLTTENTGVHRWRLVAREMRNRFYGEFSEYIGNDPFLGTPARRMDADRLDNFAVLEKRGPNFDSDNLSFIDPRPYAVNLRQFLEPEADDDRTIRMLDQGRGTSWRIVGGDPDAEPPTGFMGGLLQIYQDGPVLYTGTIGRVLAESLEEGDYAIINEDELKNANPTTAERSGFVLVLILSLTRHPSHAEYEAIRIRPAVLGVLPPPTADTPEWGGYTFFTDLHPCAPSGDLHQSTDLRFACFIWCEEPECGGDGGWVVWWTNDADDLALGCASPNNPWGYLL